MKKAFTTRDLNPVEAPAAASPSSKRPPTPPSTTSRLFTYLGRSIKSVKSNIAKGIGVVLMRGEKPGRSSEKFDDVVSHPPVSSETAVHEQSIIPTSLETTFYNPDLQTSSPLADDRITSVNPVEETLTVGDVPSKCNSSTALSVPLPPSPSSSTVSLISQDSTLSLDAFNASPSTSETSLEPSPVSGNAFASDEINSMADSTILSMSSPANASPTNEESVHDPGQANSKALLVPLLPSPALPLSPSVASDAEEELGQEEVYNGPSSPQSLGSCSSIHSILSEDGGSDMGIVLEAEDAEDELSAEEYVSNVTESIANFTPLSPCLNPSFSDTSFSSISDVVVQFGTESCSDTSLNDTFDVDGLNAMLGCMSPSSSSSGDSVASEEETPDDLPVYYTPKFRSRRLPPLYPNEVAYTKVVPKPVRIDPCMVPLPKSRRKSGKASKHRKSKSKSTPTPKPKPSPKPEPEPTPSPTPKPRTIIRAVIQSNDPIGRLPKRVVKRIFHFLGWKELADCARVCRVWRNRAVGRFPTEKKVRWGKEETEKSQKAKKAKRMLGEDWDRRMSRPGRSHEEFAKYFACVFENSLR
jgi:hypothetical protein